MRFGVPGILFFAAALKAIGLSPASNGWLTYWQVTFEVVLGVWLMSGSLSVYSRYVAAVSFTAFCLYNCWLLFHGQRFCGCFGSVHVPPSRTLALDVAITALLLFFQTGTMATLSNSSKAVGRRSPMGFVAVCASLTVLISVSLAIYMHEPTIRNSGAIVDSSQRIVVLDPARWVGHDLPVGKYLDIGQSLSSGDSVLIFYDEQCVSCQHALPLYQVFAKSRPNFIFVKVALAEQASIPISQGMKDWAVQGHLSKDHEWFATTPCVLKLHEGSVIAYREGEAAVDPSWLLN